MSDSLWPHAQPKVMLPFSSPTLRVYSNSCSLIHWCHPTISTSVVPFSSHLHSIKDFFKWVSSLIRWPKYWSFSFNISPSNEYSGLISFRMDWLELLAVQWTFKSLLQHHSSKTSILFLSFFFFFLHFFPFIFISWRLTTLQYCTGFCHTLTWIRHGFTCVPHPDPPSHLSTQPIPLGLPSAPGICLMHPAWAGDLFHPR